MNCVCGHPESAHADFGFLCNRFPCGCSYFEQDDGTDGARPLYWGQYDA